jgi:hypothetical protein
MCLQVLVEDVAEVGGRPMCSGRTDGFHKIHFPGLPIPYSMDVLRASGRHHGLPVRVPVEGDYVEVEVGLEGMRLIGEPIGLSSISTFHSTTFPV